MKVLDNIVKFLWPGQRCGTCLHFAEWRPNYKETAGWGDGDCMALTMRDGEAKTIPVVLDAGTQCQLYRRGKRKP
jgi:hypothetical protein